MSYSILWLSSTACILLIIAFITALTARCRKPLWRKFWPIFSASLLFFPVVAFGIAGFYFLKMNIQPKWLFWYGLSQTIVYIVCVLFILKKGLTGATSDNQIARKWSRGRLGIALSAAILVYGITLNIADTKILAHLAGLKSEAASNIIYLLPARLPQALNAYPVYEKAAKELGPSQELPDWFNESGTPDFDVTAIEVHDFLLEKQHVLTALYYAATIPGYNMEVDVSNFFNTPIPQYTHYRNFAKLISLSARAKARAGDVSEAFQEVLIIENMAEHLHGFPILISSIMATALEGIQYEALEYILAQKPSSPFNPPDRPIHFHPSMLDSFTRALRMEAQSSFHLLISISFSRDIFTKTGFGMDDAAEPTFLRSTFATIWWRVHILPSEIRAARDIINYWTTKPVGSYKELQTNLKALYDAAESGEMGILTGMATPNYNSYVSRVMKRDAVRGLCDMALAITLYKASIGQYPARSEDLVPAYIDQIPLDPFDNQPLKMKPIDGGLDLYSVGLEQETASDKPGEMIHFYLGREAYDVYRIKPREGLKQQN